ncbi:helix-turn-helix domain-containing protein [Actinomyces minihominis]|uniref:helix-turn-helix domain-containing protein n=1 Tax=Actinomyces minihominis TaxID=2002838 RepID=UPI000C083F87|nr:AraC family transcriptional regulator [Actinomyces minihominis]
MTISRQNELEWHRRVAEAPPLTSLGDVHAQLDKATKRYVGPEGLEAFARGGDVLVQNPEDFSAYVMDTRVGSASVSRMLITPSQVNSVGQEIQGAVPSKAELVDGQKITISVQYSGASRVRVGSINMELPPGYGRYVCSTFPTSTLYTGLSDVLTLTVPISRMPELADGLRVTPAQLLPDSAITMGMLAFASRFLFRRLVGTPDPLADESDAENALVGVTRSALIPALREGGGTPDGTVRRIIDAEIELHHRDPNLSVDRLADLVGLSRRQLYRYTGEGVAARLGRRRAETAKEILEVDPNLELTIVAHLSGFSDANRMRDHFTRAYSMLPSIYRDEVRRRLSGKEA